MNYLHNQAIERRNFLKLSDCFGKCLTIYHSWKLLILKWFSGRGGGRALKIGIKMSIKMMIFFICKMHQHTNCYLALATTYVLVCRSTTSAQSTARNSTTCAAWARPSTLRRIRATTGTTHPATGAEETSPLRLLPLHHRTVPVNVSPGCASDEFSPFVIHWL